MKKNDEYKINILQKSLGKRRQDSLWYGGRVAEIEYKGYVFIIGAYGDVIATLLDKDMYTEIAYVRDKQNLGRFLEKMGQYIKTDKQLEKLESEGRLVLENNNWFEVLIDGPDGESYDLGWVTNDYSYAGAIQEVLDEMDNVIRDIENDTRESIAEAEAEAVVS